MQDTVCIGRNNEELVYQLGSSLVDKSYASSGIAYNDDFVDFVVVL